MPSLRRPGNNSTEALHPGSLIRIGIADTSPHWQQFEFRNIDWTRHTADFYRNGDLMMADVAMSPGSGVAAIWPDIHGSTDCRIDEIVMK